MCAVIISLFVNFARYFSIPNPVKRLLNAKTRLKTEAYARSSVPARSFESIIVILLIEQIFHSSEHAEVEPVFVELKSVARGEVDPLISFKSVNV